MSTHKINRAAIITSESVAGAGWPILASGGPPFRPVLPKGGERSNAEKMGSEVREHSLPTLFRATHAKAPQARHYVAQRVTGCYETLLRLPDGRMIQTVKAR